MIAGKIFDNTPSGITLKHRRDAMLLVAEKNGHEFGKYRHISNKRANYLIWTCKKCSQTMMMDFIGNVDKGSALEFKCRGYYWL